jgi:hypothetical protein
MKRENAVAVIKEIGESCKFLNPSAITLKETSNTGQFKIHIECHIDDETWQCLKELAKKHGLGIRLTDHVLIIYAPDNQKIDG